MEVPLSLLATISREQINYNFLQGFQSYNTPFFYQIVVLTLLTYICGKMVTCG